MISEEEEWELRLENAKLRARVSELEEGIRKHRGADGNDLCWENNWELWSLVDQGASYPHKNVPSWSQFMQNCAKYRAQLDAPQPVIPSPPRPAKRTFGILAPPLITSAQKPLEKWFDQKWEEFVDANKKSPKR